MYLYLQTFVNGYKVNERYVDSEEKYWKYLNEMVEKYGDDAQTECRAL
jgi:hypothetical protein